MLIRARAPPAFLAMSLPSIHQVRDEEEWPKEDAPNEAHPKCLQKEKPKTHRTENPHDNA